MARIATGDWDAVIVAQSQFTLLPVHPRTEAEFILRELAGYRDGLNEMADEARAGGDRSWRSSEKSIQKAIQRLSARLLGCQRRLEDRKRLTQTMSFETWGSTAPSWILPLALLAYFMWVVIRRESCGVHRTDARTPESWLHALSHRS